MIGAVDRRHFLRSAATASAALAVGRLSQEARRFVCARAASRDAAAFFEITTRIDILQPNGQTRLWVPTPLAAAPYQHTLGDTYHAQGGRVVMVEDEELDMLTAEWAEGVEPVLTVTSRVATSGHAANLVTPTVPPPLDDGAFSRFLRPTG